MAYLQDPSVCPLGAQRGCHRPGIAGSGCRDGIRPYRRAPGWRLAQKRVGLPGGGKRGGARTIVACNFRDRWIFLYGFAKNERDNVDQKEERDLKRIAGALLELDLTALKQMLESGQLLEVIDG